MSQIGLLQLCGGLALSVLVQGHWNRFQLAGPPWIETTHALQSCRKREKHLKFYWSPVQSVPSIPSSMTGPSPLTSPHFVFLSISPILLLISRFIVFDTSFALPAPSFTSLYSCITPNPSNQPRLENLIPNMSTKIWFYVNRSAVYMERWVSFGP